MARNTWSRSQIFAFLWLSSALCLMVFSIFLNGYATANTLNSTTPELTVELQNELSAYDVVPDIANPLLVAASSSYDFDTDDSYQRFLTNSRPFKNLNYVPADLAPINSNFTANDARHFKLRQVAGDAFADMAWHFRDDFKGDRLTIFSAYRSKSYQDGLIKKWCAANACAKWWTSEHQAGLAVDLRVTTKWWRSISMDTPNKYTEWLHAHAQERGFHNTYQKGVAIDGKIVEGWHWRYMGVELATLLREKGMTIAEYYHSITN
jgi:LAS superfamily LD-carboxypeptidase LdcB